MELIKASLMAAAMQGGGGGNLGSLSVTDNGTYTPQSTGQSVDGWNQVTVSVSPLLQDITVNDNGVYTADSGYDGLGTVTVDLSELIRQAITEAVEGAESVCSGTSITAGDIEFPTGAIPTPDDDVLTALAVTNTMLAADVDASPVNTSNGWCLRSQEYEETSVNGIRYQLYNVITGRSIHLTGASASASLNIQWTNIGYEFNSSTNVLTCIFKEAWPSYTVINRYTVNMAAYDKVGAWNEYCSGSYYTGANPTYVGE